MKKAMLFISAVVAALSLDGQTNSYSIPDGGFLTIGNYSSSNEPKGILFTGFRDILPNYFGASIEAVNVWTCCGEYPGTGYAGIKHIGLNFNIHEPNNAGSADAKITAMSIAASGNVGIGTTSPQYKLDVDGDFKTKNHLFVGNNFQINDEGNHVFMSCLGSDNSFVFYGNNQWQQITCGNFNSTGNTLVDGSLKVAGSVGIGTTTPDQKLTVKGKIHAEEVIVDLNVPLADYVFGKDYELMPLHEVEQYVQENSHLPEIPSATEVKEKGMGVGEMQNKLLKKVEELTLYVIQQDKRIKALEEENQRLKK
jgi:Phage T4 tail fibre